MKIVPINAATLPIYRDELARLLTDAVTHGASVGYDTLILTKTPRATSTVCGRPAKGELLLWIARDERGVVGTVQLELCQKPNGRNRAEVVKLLVHSRARRNGVGQALMKTLEHSALQQQRGLLYRIRRPVRQQKRFIAAWVIAVWASCRIMRRGPMGITIRPLFITNACSP